LMRLFGWRMYPSFIGRKRKLVCAAADLRKLDEDVLKIAVKYGFGSQEVFTRNFKKMFKNTPAKYRKQHKHEADPYEKLTKIDIAAIRLNMKARHGSIAVQDQIERITGLKLVGLERIYPCLLWKPHRRPYPF
jgi:AraC family transcriptional regulator